MVADARNSCGDKCRVVRKEFFYIFSIKIYRRIEILHNYTSAAAGVLPPCGIAAWAVTHRQEHIPTWATALGPVVGAYRQAAAWPPGSAAGHSGMHGPTAVGRGGRIFLANFNF
jgi:hypothetical protein